MRSSTLRLVGRSLSAMLLITGAHAVSLSLPSLAHALGPAKASFEDLVVQAEEARAAGKFLDSARLYGRAYRMRPEAQRVDLMGEITVGNALTDYRLAYEKDPENLALLIEQGALMNEFIKAREQAHRAGDADPVPPGMVEELEQIRAQIDQLQTDEPPEPQIPPTQAGSQPESRTEPRTSDSPSSASRGVTYAILGVGVASFVGGVGLIGGGAWTFGEANRRVEDQQASLDAISEYSEAQRQLYRTQLDDWGQQAQSLATGMIIGGAILTAAGVGLTTWGAIRLWRAGKGQRAGVGGPTVAVRPRGLSVTVAF